MDLDDVLNEFGNEVLNSSNMQLSKNFIQHGNTSVYDHSIDVARNCIKLALKLKLKVDMKTLVRGSLLHDYFLYDWHVKDKSHRLHGFRHAKIAYQNASKEFDLNIVEKNMILCHMFPLNLRIPKYKESIILCIVDKVCAAKEVVNISIEKLKLLYSQR